MGDPSGIGPEVLLKALAKNPKLVRHCLVLGDSFVISKVKRDLGMDLKINLLDFSNVHKKSFAHGVESPSYGRASFEYIEGALKILAAGRAKALVTCPVSKTAVAGSGVRFSGHTEHLASSTGTDKFAMMFVGGMLKVTLVTRHISLADVPDALTTGAIRGAIELTHDALKRDFKIRSPRIGVAGLNPHAGEGGIMGAEEARIIAPAIKKAARKIRNITGPRPADVIFHEAYHNKLDAVVAMYHDQGLAPFKMLYFDRGVNMTLGLPFIRTSPDHGTAFEIAGRNTASSRSMEEALRLAARLAGI